MSVWLLDASVLLAAEDADDPHHRSARRLLRGADALATLDLAYYEVTNVAVRSWRSVETADRLVRVIDAIGVDRGLVTASAAVLRTACAIAERHGITTYDAAYVAAARHIGAELVSCDVRDLVDNGLAVVPEDVA